MSAKKLFRAVGFGVLILGLASPVFAREIKLLNASYDPTRELYEAYNQAFAKYWKTETGDNVTVQQSHGGSGKQARAVLDGLEADVVTLALAYDIDALNIKKELIPPKWQDRLPFNSSPYTSTIIFLVRNGNPRNIKDWDDLTRDGISVITPNPKTSGGARWNFLAAWAYGLKKFNGDESAVKDFVKKIYGNAPVLDTGARGSTTTFAERGIGDVLIAWENEAFLAMNQLGAGKFEIVVPSVSILAEPPVSIVDSVTQKRGTKPVALAYLKYLYSEEGQEIIAKHYFRPRNLFTTTKYANQFPRLNLVTIDKPFGGWQKAHKKFFADGGIFDQIYTPK